MSPRVDVSMSPQEIADLLARPLTAVLSTLDRTGAPHSAGMWFVHVDGEVRMWTYAKSQKAVNLKRDPRCAFLVEDGTAYNELRGVLVKGSARLIGDHEEIVSIGAALYERYTLPTTRIEVQTGPIVEIERQARKRVGIALDMDDVASWDHAKLGTV